jgi:tetratricopeptide (TPR) repeat protein
MTFSSLLTRRWLVASLVVLALTAFATAQSLRRPPSGLQSAVRALNEGRYDDVESLTEKLDSRDPSVVALKARTLMAHGRYQQAESMLRPVATRAQTSDAALELGLLLRMLGRPDATTHLTKVASLVETSEEPLELARAARALRALGRFQEANAAYRDATSSAPGDAAIQTGWGELFLEKYNKKDALKSFQMSLQADPKWTPALLGSAEALADDDPPQAVMFAKRALDVNPSSVDAHVFMAEQAVDAGHHDEARQSLQKALAINPSSLDAHALLAALDYVEDKQQDFDSEASKALAIAPNDGRVYQSAGELAAHNYRFDEAVVLTRRALALDGSNPKTLSDLGMHLLRTGDEPGARTALEKSFSLDPFNIVTLNLLKMLDTVDKFVTVRDGDLVVRMSKDEAPVLQEYALNLAHRALKDLSARYEFTPRGPILIEIFPKHDDFAVRNLGLPGMIGALGACFGRVVTMDSPRATTDPFQWEATLWHELAHVITLQMSNQRVPRWLTEGISVFEEKRARREWAREMDVIFASAMNHGDAITLRELNAAFQSPKLISMAYFEGSLVVEHLVEKYGDAGLRKLLRSYGQGLDTDVALKASLQTDLDQLQSSFDQMLDKRYADLRQVLTTAAEGNLQRVPVETLRKYAADQPRSYPIQLALGAALRKAGDKDGAIQAYERASALVPIAAGAGSPHEQMAAISLEKKDQARAVSELTALVDVDFDNVDAARQLASLLKESRVEDPQKLQPVYERIAAIDPFDADAHAVLGRFAMQRNDAEAAAREFRSALALNPVDRAGALTDLAESYFKEGKRAEAKKQTLAALEIAPTYERAQELLLKLVDNR